MTLTQGQGRTQGLGH